MSDSKRYPCKHLQCEKDFSHSSSRSHHQKRVKHNCCDNVEMCFTTITASPASLVKCRHTGCTTWCNTKHRVRHETCGIHKNQCSDYSCPACTRSDEFVRGRPWLEDLNISVLPPLNYIFKSLIL
ncbi:hypothetical protein ACTA71_002713 [Dictyostelium dimigraforme]